MTKGVEDRAEGRDAEAAGREDRRRRSRSKIRRRRSPTSPRSSRRRQGRRAAAAARARAEAAEAAERQAASRRPTEIAEAAEARRSTEQREEAEEAQRRRSAGAKKRRGQEAASASRSREPSKFDPNKIAALLDKREPQRQAATRRRRSIRRLRSARPTGKRRKLSQSEIDALRARLRRMLEPAGRCQPMRATLMVACCASSSSRTARCRPAAAADQRPRHPRSRSAWRKARMRAVLSCQPFTMLPAAQLRAVEGHRDHLRSARHVRRLTTDIRDRCAWTNTV